LKNCEARTSDFAKEYLYIIAGNYWRKQTVQLQESETEKVNTKLLGRQVSNAFCLDFQLHSLDYLNLVVKVT
jgi:hypothetical protein